ncbi:ABC transporter substrate-binding protein [Natrialbaceae archaeon A-arb3/5]
MDEGDPLTTRRRLLAGASAAATGSLAGCTDRIWMGNTGPDQVELTIKTVPADDDAAAATIASRLRENFQAAGIGAAHEPIAKADLYRDVLLDGEYDVFVVRHYGFDEYDALYGLLHSQFVTEQGWQNPFRFYNEQCDELLEAQRTDEDDRDGTLTDLFEFLEETSPYTVVAFPRRIGGVQSGIGTGIPPATTTEYLEIMSEPPEDGSRSDPLEVGVFGEGLTERLNPLVVDRNRIHGLTGLLYDPLVRQFGTGDDAEYVPWLATEVSWEEQSQATVTLRDNLGWHDGSTVDADDVMFTYRFLEDTSMGELDSGLPAPRYRGKQILVENVERIDSRTVRFSFDRAVQQAAVRALTIPIFPEHVWEPRSELVADHQTEALATDNDEPIGSGLFRLVEVTDNSVELDPFNEHVLRREPSERPDSLERFSQFSGVHFQVSPNAGTMIDALRNGEIDLTASPIPPEETDLIRNESSTTLVSNEANSFYMVGYNHDHPSLRYPHFRRLLSQLIDREHTVTELFDGFAEPASTFPSLAGIRDDRWEADDEAAVLEFPGTDGEINETRVRSLFEDEGHRYEDGELLE